MKKQEQKSEYKTLIIDETPYRTNFNKAFEERVLWEKENPKKLYSFIPGTIREIFVKKGETIKKDQVVLILEAMKMRNRIMAEHAGTVKKICVKTDEVIPKNHLLIEFE